MHCRLLKCNYLQRFAPCSAAIDGAKFSTGFANASECVTGPPHHKPNRTALRIDPILSRARGVEHMDVCCVKVFRARQLTVIFVSRAHCMLTTLFAHKSASAICRARFAD
jgi:hypothetical protein